MAIAKKRKCGSCGGYCGGQRGNCKFAANEAKRRADELGAYSTASIAPRCAPVAAPVGDDLPALPPPDVRQAAAPTNAPTAYSAELVEQIRRDAIAADRRAREVQVMQEQRKSAGGAGLTWTGAGGGGRK